MKVHIPLPMDRINSLLPGLKLELPIFTTALPVPGHESVKDNHSYIHSKGLGVQN